MAKKSGRPNAPAGRQPQPPSRPQEQMFGNLLASKPRKDKGGPAAVATSAMFHLVVISLAVWLSSQVKEAIADEDSALAQIIQPDDPEPPPPPPPPPPPENEPPPPQTEVVDIPKGFQTLAPPTIVPPDIPPPTTGPVVNERDFTGEGVRGGRSDGTTTKVTADNLEAAPAFTPFTVAPKLQNGAEVQRALTKYYPPLLRDAGIGGTVDMWFFLDETGKVRNTQLKKSSGHAALDEAAKKVAEIMDFSPALNRDQKVKVWVAMPIVFKAQ